MPEQRCACGHVYSIHRLSGASGERRECWSIKGRTAFKDAACPCQAFEPASQERGAGGSEES